MFIQSIKNPPPHKGSNINHPLCGGGHLLVMISMRHPTSRFDCGDHGPYCDALDLIKDWLLHSIVFPMTVGLLLAQLFLFSWLLSLFSRRPKLKNFGRGFSGKVQDRIRIVGLFWLVFLAGWILLDWRSNVAFTQAHRDMLNLLQNFTEDMLVDLKSAVLGIGDLTELVTAVGRVWGGTTKWLFCVGGTYLISS